MNNNLVLISSSFPYGTGETFLETEINYLASTFQNLYIITSDITSTELRKIPENCTVIRVDLSYTKILTLASLRNLSSKLFIKELIHCVKTYGFSKGLQKITTILISLERAKRLNKVFRKHDLPQNNILFYSYWCDDSALSLCLLKEKQKNIKIVSRAHGWDLYFERGKDNYLPFRKYIGERLDRLFPISDLGKNYIERRWKIRNQAIEVQRLGTNEQYNYQFPQLDKEFRIVSCSSLIPLKRVELIAEAIATITDIPLTWTHIGSGPELDKIKLKLKSAANYHSLHLAGELTNEEVIAYYRNTKPHLFINLSTTEGIPVSIMEAMSLGIPAMATNVGGTSELVSNKNGILLPSNPTAIEVATEIRKLINLKEEEFNLLQNNAYNTWKKHYNADKNYRHFAQLLKQL